MIDRINKGYYKSYVLLCVAVLLISLSACQTTRVTRPVNPETVTETAIIPNAEDEEVQDEENLYLQRAIINKGNTYRLNQVMERARNGELITIGFIGGSITMGSGASSQDNCYAKLVYNWWCNTFPEAEFNYINAGIGATTSQFACYRLEEDLLSKKPDVVIVEFSVNDEDTQKYSETYESLLRGILTSETEPAVIVLNMVNYSDGTSAQTRHNIIAFRYQVPMISMKDSIYEEILSGNLTASDVSGDNLHPNDRGHAYAAEIVTNYLGLVNDRVYEISDTYEVPDSLNILFSLNSKLYNNLNSEPVLDGFTKDTTIQNNITEVFRKGFSAGESDASITFEVSGSNISIMYRKTNRMNAPKAIAVIDGDEENAVQLDGNFPDGWGDWLYMHDIAKGLNDTVHTVEVRITESGENDFYLVSVIGTE